MSSKIIAFVGLVALTIVIAGIFDPRLSVTRAVQSWQYERGRASELAREKAESPDFADGYSVGERMRAARGGSLAPEQLKALSQAEFARSGRTDSLNWRVGFQMGFEAGAEKARR